jgi:hypothetical protein
VEPLGLAGEAGEKLERRGLGPPGHGGPVQGSGSVRARRNRDGGAREGLSGLEVRRHDSERIPKEDISISTRADISASMLQTAFPRSCRERSTGPSLSRWRHDQSSAIRLDQPCGKNDRSTPEVSERNQAWIEKRR